MLAIREEQRSKALEASKTAAGEGTDNDLENDMGGVGGVGGVGYVGCAGGIGGVGGVGSELSDVGEKDGGWSAEGEEKSSSIAGSLRSQDDLIPPPSHRTPRDGEIKSLIKHSSENSM